MTTLWMPARQWPPHLLLDDLLHAVYTKCILFQGAHRSGQKRHFTRVSWGVGMALRESELGLQRTGTLCVVTVLLGSHWSFFFLL